MNREIQKLVNPNLYNCILELAKDDIVIQQILKKTNYLDEFVNALLAGIICVIDRQHQNELKIAKLIEANPEVQKIFKPTNDTSMLSTT